MAGVAEGGVTPGATLGVSATRGVLWSTAQKWVARLGGLVTIAIVARHLSPDDFGLMAIALMVMPLIYLIADFGFSTYIVQLDDAPRSVLDTAFWYSFGAGVLLAAGLALVGPAVGALVGIDGIAAVLIGVSPAALFAALSGVPTAILRRRMAFKPLALQAFVGSLVGQIVAVVIAVLGGGVWALVAQMGVSQFGITLLAWVSARWRPGFTFSGEQFGRMTRFGANIVGVEIFAIARSWAETTIITLGLGVASLGIYNIAQRLIQTAQDLSTAAMAPVATVVFAQVRDDGERLRSGYLRALSLTYAVIIPIMTVIAVSAGDIVPLLFGQQWTRSVLPSQALAVAAILIAGAALDHGLHYGLGRPGRWLVYAIGIDALTVLATFVAVAAGLFGIALGLVVVAVIATIVRWFLVSRMLGASLWQVAKPLVTVGTAGLVGAGGGLAVNAATAGLPSIVSLLLAGATIGACYLVALRLTAPGTLAELVGIVVRPVLTRLRRRSAHEHANRP